MPHPLRLLAAVRRQDFGFSGVHRCASMRPMKYYPMFLRVADRRCLVVGGGKVAEQKVTALVEAAAHVTVISPVITSNLQALTAAQAITHHARQYASGDVRGFFLAFAATDDEQTQEQLARDAQSAGALLNVVDRPGLCDFIVPAVMEQGDLVIATSTGGASPALAKRIRRDLQESFGPEYAEALRLLRRVRGRLAARSASPADRRRVFTALANSPLLEYLRRRQTDAIDQLLAETVGDGVSLATLGMDTLGAQLS
ncbi:MAG: bifunctional precorrin-2 dehydrogenase/sirohydrochlorin ferrochelatase [Candidatus Binatia bacterium]|jgi:precorrin-2 dehydrogenase / sirohydrochlorin ferrochelatase